MGLCTTLGAITGVAEMQLGTRIVLILNGNDPIENEELAR